MKPCFLYISLFLRTSLENIVALDCFLESTFFALESFLTKMTYGEEGWRRGQPARRDAGQFLVLGSVSSNLSSCCLWLGWSTHTCVTAPSIAEHWYTASWCTAKFFAKCAARLRIAQDCKWCSPSRITQTSPRAFVTFKVLYGTRVCVIFPTPIRKVRPLPRRFSPCSSVI